MVISLLPDLTLNFDLDPQALLNPSRTASCSSKQVSETYSSSFGLVKRQKRAASESFGAGHSVLRQISVEQRRYSCSFVQLCLEGFYDGLPFHRIVPNFIAQTGDDTGTGGGGESIYDEGEFEDEFSQVSYSRSL